MATALEALFTDYAAHHQTAGNRVCHAVGIPLIVVGAARLLAIVEVAVVGPVSVTLTELVLAAMLVYYVRLSAGLALVMAICLGALVAFGRVFLSVPVALAAHALGWTLQLVGHKVFEKRSPAFAHNLRHLLVGPAWMVARAFTSSTPRP